MGKYSMLMDQKKMVKVSMLTKATYRFSATPIQISMPFCTEIKQS